MATKTVRLTGPRGGFVDIEKEMAMIEKSQQLAGHFPDAEALGRARRLFERQVTEASAYAELDIKYSQE